MPTHPDYNQIAAALAEIADAIDMITAETWTHELKPSDQRIVLESAKDGARLYIDYNDRCHKYNISGDMSIRDPQNRYHSMRHFLRRDDAPERYEINCSTAKSAAQVAADAQRRSCGGHNSRRRQSAYNCNPRESRPGAAGADRAEALEHYDEQQRQRAWATATAAELAAIVNGRIFEDYRDHDTFYAGKGIPGDLKARVSYGYGVTFERLSHVPLPIARRILELLRDAAEQPRL
jgi:hypothetical protein